MLSSAICSADVEHQRAVAIDPCRVSPSRPRRPSDPRAGGFGHFAGLHHWRAPSEDSGYAGPPAGRSIEGSAAQPNMALGRLAAYSLVMNSWSAASLPTRSSALPPAQDCCAHSSHSRVAGLASMLLTVCSPPTLSWVKLAPAVDVQRAEMNEPPLQPQAFSPSPASVSCVRPV